MLLQSQVITANNSLCPCLKADLHVRLSHSLICYTTPFDMTYSVFIIDIPRIEMYFAESTFTREHVTISVITGNSITN